MRSATRNSKASKGDPVQLVAVQTRVTDAEAKTLERLADANYRSVSAELRIAIKNHLAHANGEAA